MTRVVVLSDTHIGRTGTRLPDAVYDALATLTDGDAILHAGDVVVPELLAELSGFAPVHAVLGNNDCGLFGILPETRVVEIDGITIGMIHDSGATSGREGRMRRRFAHADLVVFGHSHAPCDTLGIDGQRLFNPGSPTQRRLQPVPTFGMLELSGGRLVRHEVVPIA